MVGSVEVPSLLFGGGGGPPRLEVCHWARAALCPAWAKAQLGLCLLNPSREGECLNMSKSWVTLEMQLLLKKNPFLWTILAFYKTDFLTRRNYMFVNWLHWWFS